MGLSSSELNRVPSGINDKECYQSIRNWLLDYGIDYARQNASKKQYYFCEKFSKSLPKPVDSCQSGREYIFLLVIAGPLEIFYNLRDSSGVKIAAYAHHALNLKYKNAYPIKKITEAAKNSAIYNLEKKLNQELQKLAADKS